MKEPGLELSASSRLLVNGLAEALAQVLESMTDRRPAVDWSAQRGRPEELEAGAEAEMLWWEQSFQILPKPALWLGTPRAAWEELGARTLRAAGLEEIETADARNTWLEILSQSLSAVARLAGQTLGQEVACSEGAERQPPSSSAEWVRLQVAFEEPLPPLWATLGSDLVERLEAAKSGAPDGERGSGADPSAAARGPAAGSRTMDLLLDVELPVSISFGRSQVPLKDVLKLTTGSIVELNRTVAEPVEVLVNDSLIARGEVVVVDGNYAVRIQHIVSLQDRLRSVR